jgi:hypothetical protein
MEQEARDVFMMGKTVNAGGGYSKAVTIQSKAVLTAKTNPLKGGAS